MTEKKIGDTKLKPWTAYHTLIKKTIDRCIPQTAVLELTYRCNFRCIQCYVLLGDKRDKELTVEELDSVMEQLASMGTLYLILTGGEIFVRKDVWEIMDLTRKHRFAVHLFTNGYALTEEIVDRLDGYGNLMGLSISMYGHDSETYEKVTQVRGSYERVKAGIQRLVDRDLNIRIKTPIIETNYCSLDMIREYCDDLDVTYRPTPVITPRDDGSTEPTRYRIDDETLKDYLRGQDLSYLDNRNPKKDVPVCTSGRNQLTIAPDGELYPCIQIRESAGNVREKPLKEMWESGAMDFIRNLTINEIPKCAKCKHLKYCNPCFGLGWTEFGTVKKPSKETCRITKIVREIYLDRLEKTGTSKLVIK
ncbi:radical SAM protein [Acidobacteriota bacterium]